MTASPTPLGGSRLGILPEFFIVEGRAGLVGRNGPAGSTRAVGYWVVPRARPCRPLASVGYGPRAPDHPSDRPRGEVEFGTDPHEGKRFVGSFTLKPFPRRCLKVRVARTEIFHGAKQHPREHSAWTA